jgi:hypothetical protein
VASVEPAAMLTAAAAAPLRMTRRVVIDAPH